MKIKKFLKDHPEILRRVFECQVEQGNTPNDRVCLADTAEGGNFDWNNTAEGDMFWNFINAGDFDVFYRRQSTKKEEDKEEPQYEYVLVMKEGGKECHRAVTKDQLDFVLEFADVIRNGVLEPTYIINEVRFVVKSFKPSYEHPLY